jgi:para-nitrobenzyl esterase
MDRRSFLTSSSLAAAGLIVGASTPGSAQTPPAARRGASGPVVETSLGRVRGYMDDRVNAFRGIPYGASTAGANRFLPPAKAQGWTGVRDAVELGLRAPQLQDPRVPEFSVMDRAEPSGEDCLVLNVWTPALNDGERRPVMVWLHGGGFSSGSAGFTCYDGANLARKHNVVVVGVNHRLNIFGYLYLAEVGGVKYAGASNVGMLDIVAALEWVRDNAARFGGDPANVTIFGQSGGGQKVSALLGMPAARGLFHKAIAMSGSQVRSGTRENATRSARTVLERLGIGVDGIEQLHALSWRRIRGLLGGQGLNFGPVVDGRTIPANNFDPVATDVSIDVPLMIGSTETEQTWNANQLYDALSDAELREDVMRVLRTDGSGADQAIAVYRKNRPRATNLDLYLILISDASNFRTGTDTQADRKAAQGRAAVYKYYFQWYSPVRGGQLRSMHTMDIPFAFDNAEIAASLLGRGPEVQALADKMSAAYVAFARTGNPNDRLIPNWPAYTQGQRATMIWNDDVKVVNDPYREEKDVIAAVSGRVPPPGGRGRGAGPGTA